METGKGAEAASVPTFNIFIFGWLKGGAVLVFNLQHDPVAIGRESFNFHLRCADIPAGSGTVLEPGAGGAVILIRQTIIQCKPANICIDPAARFIGGLNIIGVGT